jgi:hypothetical protein
VTSRNRLSRIRAGVRLYRVVLLVSGLRVILDGIWRRWLFSLVARSAGLSREGLPVVSSEKTPLCCIRAGQLPCQPVGRRPTPQGCDQVIRCFYAAYYR